MPGWTLVDTHPTQGRTFQRPLDKLELCFLWDRFLGGTADSVHYYELSLHNGARDAHLFSEANIVRAWLSTKRRYPLAGATVCGADGAPLQIKTAPDANADTGTGFVSEPHFVVRECKLNVLGLREIEFGQVTGAEEARQYAAAILHGPRTLPGEMLARLYVLRETDAGRADVVHLMIVLAHCLSDGVANRTFMRCLFDTLARGEGSEPIQVPLEERLAMAIPWTDLQPVQLRSLSPAIRRWRRAVGMVIFRLRIAKSMRGGHTLPWRRTRLTWHTPARPGLVSTSLTPAQTDTVIANCRLHDLTFGNAYLALAQVAMTRVLYRRYLRGEISEEEWEYRKRQPHINGGPLNLRRFLDKAWYDNGGGGEFMLCISLYIYRLSFMALGTSTERDQAVLLDGAPPFSDLLTFERFLHRAKLVKRQANAHLSHPLLLEILYAAHVSFVPYMHQRALLWMQRAETAKGHDTHEDSDENKVLAVIDAPSVIAHGGATLGNMNLMAPSEYPLPRTHALLPYSPTPHPMKAGYVSSSYDSETDTMPRIAVENTKIHLRTRPEELFLGAVTSRGQMDMYVHYDGNVFEEEVVKEWLDEVREAVLWYLGRTTQ